MRQDFSRRILQQANVPRHPRFVFMSGPRLTLAIACSLALLLGQVYGQFVQPLSPMINWQHSPLSALPEFEPTEEAEDEDETETDRDSFTPATTTAV
jgi:hypothetical protein